MPLMLKIIYNVYSNEIEINTIIEIRKRLNDAGIYQLRKGETVKDAIDYLDGKLPGGRKGFQIKRDDGSKMTENEIRQSSQKEAFAKHCSEPEYIHHDLTNVEISKLEDYRNDYSKQGVIEPCQYCGKPLRTDYEGQYDILTCESPKCGDWAILKNCM